MPELMTDHPSGTDARPVDFYLGEFRERRAQLAREPRWLREKRLAAIERSDGSDSRRPGREWRFTSVAPIAAMPIPRAVAPAGETPTAVPADIVALRPAAELVFVNGVFASSIPSAQGLPAGVRVENLSNALRVDGAGLAARLGALAETGDHAFEAMNAASFADAAVVVIPAGTRLVDPIHLVFLADNPGSRISVYPRVLVAAGAGAKRGSSKATSARTARSTSPTRSRRSSSRRRPTSITTGCSARARGRSTSARCGSGANGRARSRRTR